ALGSDRPAGNGSLRARAAQELRGFERCGPDRACQGQSGQDHVGHAGRWLGRAPGDGPARNARRHHDGANPLSRVEPRPQRPHRRTRGHDVRHADDFACAASRWQGQDRGGRHDGARAGIAGGSHRCRVGIAGLPRRHLVRDGGAAADARGLGRQDQSRCGRDPRSTGRDRKDARNSDGAGHQKPRGGSPILRRGGAALGQGDQASWYSTAIAPDRKSRHGCIRDRPALSTVSPEGEPRRGAAMLIDEIEQADAALVLVNALALPVKAAWRGLGVPHTVATKTPVWDEEFGRMKLPRNFFKPLAIGAPAPLRELPVKLERMIHFVPPHIQKLRAKLPELIAEVDVVLGNLEDAIPADAKQAARAGFIAMAKANEFGATGLWTRINALNSPWMLDDVVEIVGAVGEKLDVVMLPKVEGPWD